MKFYIDYLDSDGDLCHVWVDAFDKNEAEEIAKREYWDIDSIINVYQKK